MKKLRKLLSVAVAALAAASLAVTTTVTSFAADDPGSITITGTNEKHTYEAYQIFSGRLEGTTLSDIEWGNGVTDTTTLLNEIKAVDGFDGCDSAADVAEALKDANLQSIADIISKHLNSANAKTLTTSGTSATVSDIPVGYYLIKDIDKSLENQDEAYTRFIVKVVGAANATVKSDKPTLDKKVLDDDDDAENGKTWQDVADYDIGDEVPFKLTATMPDNIGDYEKYTLVFEDTMSEGLTYVDVTDIKINGTSVENLKDDENILITGEGQSLTVTITDLLNGSYGKITQDTTVEVYFKAKLNEKAEIGNAKGNPNKAYLEYSNNPNVGGEGDKGKTPEAKVVVFTYQLNVEKVDGEKTTDKLEGAEFKLQNADGQYLVIDPETNKVVKWGTAEEASTLKTDASGLITVIGLDEGTYTLTETKAPTGYNKLSKPVELVITADDVHDQDYDGSNAKELCPTINITADGELGSADAASGVLGAEIANHKGTTLPETGGIGTTIFFVGGGIVVAGAAILLIVKRRMRSDS